MNSDLPFVLSTFPLKSQLFLDFQEARMKDTLELAREPNFNLKAYLQDAYLHPVFKGGEVECDYDVISEKADQENMLVQTKRQSRRNTPAPSKGSGGSSPSFRVEVIQEKEQPWIHHTLQNCDIY